MAAANVTYAYEAVEHLRPQWLTWRPSRYARPEERAPLVPVVFLDDTYYGELNELWTLAVVEIEEIRFLDDKEAVYRYGTTYNSGIIQVISR